MLVGAPSPKRRVGRPWRERYRRAAAEPVAAPDASCHINLSGNAKPPLRAQQLFRRRRILFSTLAIFARQIADQSAPGGARANRRGARMARLFDSASRAGIGEGEPIDIGEIGGEA